jgi:hypothetical protein
MRTTDDVLQRKDAETGPSKFINDSPYPIQETRHVEINQEPEPLVHESQVRQQLRAMNRQQSLDSFNFHDDRLVNEQVQSVAGVEVNPVVGDGDDLFASNGMAVLVQFVDHAFAIRTFEQARSELPMNTNSALNYLQ